jgi:hypothetical protein
MTVIKNLGRHMKVGGAVAAAARVCRLAPLARERREAGGASFCCIVSGVEWSSDQSQRTEESSDSPYQYIMSS